MLTFERSERLKSRKLLGRLFQEGHSFMAFPLRVLWLPLSDGERQFARFGPYPAQVAISVPKRLHKSAVTRNRIRRQVREAYRLHKHLLYEALNAKGLHIALILVFTAKEEPTAAQLAHSMRKLSRTLAAWPTEETRNH